MSAKKKMVTCGHCRNRFPVRRLTTNEIKEGYYVQCNECGKKLRVTRMEKNKPKSPVGKKMKVLGYCASLLFLVSILFSLFAPTKTHFYMVDVPYEGLEYYYEKEPYQSSEAYVVQVPYESTEVYQDTVPVEVDVPYSTTEEKKYAAPSGQYYTTIPSSCRCTEYNFWGKCVELSCQQTVTEYRTETQYQTIEKERPVTKYQEETKYREVTLYQDVRKSRDVIKIRQEQRQYEVNWLFKFRVPWFFHIRPFSYR